MSYRYYHKTTCDRVNKTSLVKNQKCSVQPKRVLLSKKVGSCPTGKSCSDGIITEEWQKKPRKTTQSEVSINSKSTRKTIDYCKRCGDQVHTSSQSSSSDKAQTIKSNTNLSKTPSNTSKVVKKTKSKADSFNHKPKHSKSNGVKQYYKNENFKSSISLQDTEAEFRKISLDTIKEIPEGQTRNGSGVNIYNVLSDSEEDIGFLDTNDVENIEELKKFREDNYFECHSVKSRIDNKASVTSLVDHKCVYRFYLNDRLFPVPLSTDHHNNVRCVECHLPINLKMENDSDNPNGSIQAKVKLSDNEMQDMVLLLPVKDALIIKEKRMEIKSEEDVLYFGVIKLGTYGNSVFNSNLPSDSLALKYQKGYQEYGSNQDYKYKGVEKDDIIII